MPNLWKESELLLRHYRLAVYAPAKGVQRPPKRLTILGECHYYRSAELPVLFKYMADHRHVAIEYGHYGRSPMAWGTMLRKQLLVWSHLLPVSVFRLRSGRFCGNALEELRKHHPRADVKVYGLEDANQAMNMIKVSAIVPMALLRSLLTPLLLFMPTRYFRMDNLIKESAWERRWDLYGISRRDAMMAAEIRKLLMKSEVDHLLVVVGASHVAGIIERLKESYGQSLVPETYGQYRSLPSIKIERRLSGVRFDTPPLEGGR